MSDVISSSVSLRSQYEAYCLRYDASLKGGRGDGPAGDEGGLAAATPATVRSILEDGEALWRSALALRVWSSNESVEEVSTTGLELMRLPYLLSVLYLHYLQEMPSGNPDTGSTPALSIEEMSVMRSVFRHAALLRSQYWVRTFLEEVTSMGLFTVDEISGFGGRVEKKEGDVEGEGLSSSSSTLPPSLPRERRMQLSQLRSASDASCRQLEERLAYERVRRRRFKSKLHQDDEDDGELNSANERHEDPASAVEGRAVEVEDDNRAGEEEDVMLEERRRELAILRLKAHSYAACEQQMMSDREVAMLAAIDPSRRLGISQHYQTMLKDGNRPPTRQTYTILPDGSMMAGTPSHPKPVPSSTVQQSGGAAQRPAFFAQQVRDELMIDRNPPTQTLQAFAEGEMALAFQQADAMKVAQEEQQREDEALGQEGREERDRVKDSRWSDWKDDNPRFGKTSKGNYT